MSYTTRDLLISLASHMAYMQGQLQARHDPDEADLEDCYWYAESVALRQMVSDHLAAEAQQPSSSLTELRSSPADGEVAELVRMLTGIAHWRRRGRPGECDPSPFDIRQAARLTRAAELLERQVLQPPADGEVVEVVEWLHTVVAAYKSCHNTDHIWSLSGNGVNARLTVTLLTRAAELLQRQAQQTLPQGLIPMEYVDADSSARIVSEPSEDGPGGCWVVRNSRHVNPCTEFPTAEAAWDALQRAQSLPLPEVGE